MIAMYLRPSNIQDTALIGQQLSNPKHLHQAIYHKADNATRHTYVDLQCLGVKNTQHTVRIAHLTTS